MAAALLPDPLWDLVKSFFADSSTTATRWAAAPLLFACARSGIAALAGVMS
jgi:hypothetical protein